jgi:hypothetical protein
MQAPTPGLQPPACKGQGPLAPSPLYSFTASTLHLGAPRGTCQAARGGGAAWARRGRCRGKGDQGWNPPVPTAVTRTAGTWPRPWHAPPPCRPGPRPPRPPNQCLRACPLARGPFTHHDVRRDAPQLRRERQRSRVVARARGYQQGARIGGLHTPANGHGRQLMECSKTTQGGGGRVAGLAAGRATAGARSAASARDAALNGAPPRPAPRRPRLTCASPRRAPPALRSAAPPN